MSKPALHPTRLQPKAQIPHTLPAANALVPRAVLCALIATRLTISRNLASHHIGYAVKSEKLVEAKPGYFIFEGAGAWARLKWPGMFDDFPMKEGTISAGITIPALLGSGQIRTLPATLPECQAELDKAMHRFYTVEDELKLAQEELARLRPIAQRDAERRHKNRESGKKGGRGKQK